MKTPTRPKSVPAEAVWVESEKEWQLGKIDKRGIIKRVEVPIGEWRYWREDGTLCCIAGFDEEGRQHGLLERYHNDGTLASKGEWKAGHRHGHFTYYQSENKTDESYPVDSRTWRYEFDSEANWEEHNVRYFLKDGAECTSDGRPLSEAFDLDTILGAAEPVGFLRNNAKDISKKLSKEFARKNPKKDPLDLQELWGTTAPEIDDFVNNMVDGYEVTIATGRRTFEDNVWESLIAHPWDNVSEEMGAAFMGAVKIGSLGDSDQVYCTLFHPSREKPLPNAVFLWDHDTYHIDEVLSLTLDEFAYRVSISTGFELERLSKAAARSAWKKLSGRCYVGYHASGGLQEAAEDEEEDSSDSVEDIEDDENDDDDNDELNGESPYKVDLDPKTSITGPFWRAQWIIELLSSDERRNWNDVKECFRPKRNLALDDKVYESLKNSGNERIYSTALYLLWRLFWFGYEERLKECCDLYRKHPARIVRDLVTLLEEFKQGRKQVGEIKDIFAVREKFLSLDLAPEREQERTNEKQKSSQAETERVQVIAKEAKQIAAKGKTALLDLAWSSVKDVNAMAEFEKAARALPDYDAQWMCLDWVRNQGYLRDNGEEKNEAIGVGIWLGQNDSEILQPFIWSSIHQDGPALAAGLLLPAIGRTKGALDSRLIDCCLNQLDIQEEYNHKRTLAVELLGTMGAVKAVPRLCKLFDEYFEEIGTKRDFEARLAAIPFESLLTTTAKVLDSLAPLPDAHEFSATARSSLRKLLEHAIKEYQHSLVAPTLRALVAWGETDILPLIGRILNANDTNVELEALRAVESLASKAKTEDLKQFVIFEFRNPSDNDNAVTLMFYRAANAIQAVDPELVETETMSRALEEARQLGTYGEDLWTQWRIVECETVGKFPELEIESIAQYLQSSNMAVREAAEQAYSARGVEFQKGRPVFWPHIWTYARNDDVSDISQEMLAARQKAVADLLAKETSVDLSAPAAWLWEHPGAPAAAEIAKTVERKLKQLQRIDSGQYLPSEYVWLMRALGKHAQFSPCKDLILHCLTNEQPDVVGALVQEIDSLPHSMAQQLLKIASNDSGWQRYQVAHWATKHKDSKEVAAALKANGITDKKLKSWMN